MLLLEQQNAEAAYGPRSGINQFAQQRSKRELAAVGERSTSCHPAHDCCEGRDTRSRVIHCGHNNRTMPGLEDVFGNTEGHVVSIFNLRRDTCSSCLKVPWESAAWTCDFVDDWSGSVLRTNGTASGGDPHQLTLVIDCPAPVQKPNDLSTVSLRGSWGAFHAVYKNVTFCSYPLTVSAVPLYQLVACTQISHSVAHLVPEWIAYHVRQGVDHFDIYVNGEVEPVYMLLRSYVLAGIVDVVRWDFPGQAGSFLHQQTQQNSCIRRYRQRAQWVALLDVDELLHPVGAYRNTSVATWLRLQQHGHSIGGYQLNTCFWGSSINNTEQQLLDAASHLTIGRYQYRAADVVRDLRQKCIVRPNNVHYFSTHMITSGGEMVSPDPNAEVQIAHFKLPWSCMYDVHDVTLDTWTSLIKSDLKDMT